MWGDVYDALSNYGQKKYHICMSILRYSGHNLKDDRDKLTAEVMLETLIGGAIKLDNNQNLLMVEIDENLLTKKEQ